MGGNVESYYDALAERDHRETQDAKRQLKELDAINAGELTIGDLRFLLRMKPDHAHDRQVIARLFNQYVNKEQP